MGDSFRAKDISLNVQKKLMSKMSNKQMAKTFVDETYSNILDNLYLLAKNYSGSKKDAEKLVKNVIKIIVKINILSRNDKFTGEELKIANKLRSKFSTVVKTVICFFEVEFSFDKSFLTKSIRECREALTSLVENHLTDKSIGRIDFVLDFFEDPQFLDEAFNRDSQHRPLMQLIIDGMNKAVEMGDI